MNSEIETRFLEIDKADLLFKLSELGATDHGEKKIHEIIFYDKDKNWLKENTFVRIREKGNVITLTYKKNPKQEIDTAREIEFEISDVQKAKIFLESLGLVAYRIVEKIRHTLILDGVTIDIDTWPKIPKYVELEGSSVNDLKNIAAKLGFNWEERFDGDARFVFKKYGFDFDNIKTVTFDKFE